MVMAERSSPISTVVLATTISIRSMRRFCQLRAGVGRAVGDAAHLFQDLAVEAAQEKRVGGGAVVVPPASLRAEVGGAALQVFGNLARHQVAVLVAALVGLAFDVQIDPPGGRIAVGGAEGLDGFAGRPFVAASRLRRGSRLRTTPCR